MGDLIKAAIYCRISRDAEGEQTGVQRQEALCRELAERMGLEVVEVYVDNDIGASEKTKAGSVRPFYNQLFADARSNKFAYILAYSNSRLTRRMAELEEIIKLHEETGVTVQTVVSGNDDLSTSDGRLAARIKATVDVAESERISERQKAAFLHKARSGEPKLQRQRPFGWKSDGVTLQPDEAQLIRDAVEKITGGASITTIRREWETSGIRTAAGGDKWEWSVLKKVLLGWRTAGVRTYHREPVQSRDGSYVRGTWEQIISLEQREAALATLAKRSLTKVRQGKWLLSGLVRCGECGGKMYGQLPTGSRNVPTYACKPGNGHVAISAEQLEWLVYGAVVNRTYRRVEAEFETGSQPESLPRKWDKEDELRHLSTQYEELMAAWRSGSLPSSIVFPEIDAIETDRKKLVREQQVFNAEQAEQAARLASHEELREEFAKTDILVSDEEKHLRVKRELNAVVVRKGKRGKSARAKNAIRDRLTFDWK